MPAKPHDVVAGDILVPAGGCRSLCHISFLVVTNVRGAKTIEAQALKSREQLVDIMLLPDRGAGYVREIWEFTPSPEVAKPWKGCTDIFRPRLRLSRGDDAEATIFENRRHGRGSFSWKPWDGLVLREEHDVWHEGRRYSGASPATARDKRYGGFELDERGYLRPNRDKGFFVKLALRAGMPNMIGNPVIFEAMEAAVLDHFGAVPLNPLDALPVMEEAGRSALKIYAARFSGTQNGKK